jgi:ketosteroid isomerase-like protein
MHKYQPQVMADYLAIVDADPGWQRLMDAYDPDVLLLSPDATVVKGPAQDAGWCEAYRDERQVLLLRDCGTEAG